MNQNPDKEELFKQLGLCLLPDTDTKLVDINSHFKLENKKLTVSIPVPLKTKLTKLKQSLQSTASAHTDFQDLDINIKCIIKSHKVQDELKPMANIKNIIAVASGKGGVGKSTVTTNLALALQKLGAKVGILDADIYGPSIGHIFEITDQHPETVEQKYVKPVESHGLQLMSMSVLVEEQTPMVWRGPMASRAMEQLLNQTIWTDLDYLIIDLPPGTGDIQLTLAKSTPVTGAVVVTTPQDLALLDVKRAIEMFRKVHVSILGVIENMAMITCEKCGHEEHFFGTGGPDSLAETYSSKILGSLPLDRELLKPVSSQHPLLSPTDSSRTYTIMENIALETAIAVAKNPVNLSIPNISSS